MSDQPPQYQAHVGGPPGGAAAAGGVQPQPQGPSLHAQNNGAPAAAQQPGQQPGQTMQPGAQQIPSMQWDPTAAAQGAKPAFSQQGTTASTGSAPLGPPQSVPATGNPPATAAVPPQASGNAQNSFNGTNLSQGQGSAAASAHIPAQGGAAVASVGDGTFRPVVVPTASLAAGTPAPGVPQASNAAAVVATAGTATAGVAVGGQGAPQVSAVGGPNAASAADAVKDEPMLDASASVGAPDGTSAPPDASAAVASTSGAGGSSSGGGGAGASGAPPSAPAMNPQMEKAIAAVEKAKEEAKPRPKSKKKQQPPKPTEDDLRILPKPELRKLLSFVSENDEVLDTQLEDALMAEMETFLDSAIASGCSLAHMRRSDVLSPQDVAICLERQYHMYIPGYVGERTIRQYRRTTASEVHKERHAAVRKSRQQDTARQEKEEDVVPAAAASSSRGALLPPGVSGGASVDNGAAHPQPMVE